MNTTNAHDSTQPGERPAQKPVARPRRRRRWWVSLLLAVGIFGSGFAVGGATALIVAKDRFLHMLHHPEEAPAKITARLRCKLDLTDEQAAQVEAILRRHQEAFEAIRADVQPRVEAELDGVEKDIAAVLDDSQRAQWHQRFTELRETWMPPPPKPPAESP
jgi:hypothetical protein